MIIWDEKTKYVDIVFDGPPGNESGRFVEVEDNQGKGIGWFGEWQQRPDGYWVLRIERADTVEFVPIGGNETPQY